jgi:AcrR family transcriptional regulator
MPRVVPGYKHEARARVLNAAAKVFAERGYHRATMDDVARSIGVSKGAIYLYFRSKEELFDELCRTCLEVFENTLHSSLTGGDFLNVASLYFVKEMEQPAESRVLWLESLAETPRNEVIRKVLWESYGRFRKVLTEFLEGQKTEGNLGKEVSIDSLTGFLLALHDGLLVGMAQGLSEADARKMWNEGVTFFVKGITGPHPHKTGN